MTAVAAVLTGPRAFELRELELPEPGPDQVLLDVVACGVCGSNLHDWETPGRGVLGAPGAVGHEISARVAVAGERVDVTPGAIVAVQPSTVSGCQTCSACREGAWWFCTDKHAPGPYGFATQMLVPSSAVVVLPNGVPAELAALVEPVACGIHAVRHSWTARESGRLDDRRVVVLGAGMLGLSAVVAARWAGAAHVVAVARHPHQAEAARRLGADEVLDAGRDDLVAVLRSGSPDLVVEAAGGGGETLDLAIAVTRRRGEVVVLGAFPGRVPVEIGRLLNREIRLYCAVSYGRRDGIDDFALATELVIAEAGALAGLVTHRFALEEIDAAFEVAADKRSGCIRAIVSPSDGLAGQRPGQRSG